jgi:CRP-like cAMP-binding protein
VLSGLPPGLARSVKMELFADVLQLSPFFYGMEITTEFSDGGVVDNMSQMTGVICDKFGLLYKTMGLQLTAAGEIPDAMFIVRSGMLSVLNAHGKQIMTAQPGDVVGEMALLGLSADGRRLRSSSCLTMCELVCIEKEDLEELMSIEGFRLPLRRMLSQYIDGLAGHVIKPGEATGSDPSTADEGKQEDLWDDFAFNNIPWRKIKTRLTMADEHQKLMAASTLETVSKPEKLGNILFCI